MIQRKQTVFLFIALLVTIACLCLPVGSFEPKGMGAENQLMNLWLSDADGGKNFNVWALFAILLYSATQATPASKDSTQSEAAISMDTVFRHIKNSRRCLENRKDGCSVE